MKSQYLKDLEDINCPRIPYSFLIAPTNPKEICDIINTLDEHKSTGPSSIPTKMLKLVRNELSLSFSDICNTSFKEDIFPDKNKIAKVIPSHNKKDPLMMSIIIANLTSFNLLLVQSWRN